MSAKKTWLKQGSAIIATSLMLLSLSPSALAGDAGMQQLFNDMGVYANSTPSGSFKGQTMNSYTGGGLSARASQKNYQFATFDPPRIGASCGGIDLYTGAFSFINSDQIVNLLRNASSNATGYLFSLALESICPSCASGMKFLQDQAAKMNALNMNSCELATGVVDAVGPALGLKTNNNDSKLAGKITGLYDDFTASGQSIAETPAKQNQITEARRASTAIKEWDKKLNVNVIWRALSDLNISGTSLTTEEKEVIMSMVGTVIVSDIPAGQTSAPEGAAQVARVIGPTMDLEAFIEGVSKDDMGMFKLTCVDNPTDQYGCLTVRNDPWPTDAADKRPFKARVRDAIDHLMGNIDARSGTPSTAEFQLINASSLPVWKLIANYSQLPSGAALSEEYSDMIATDIAYQYYLRGIRAAQAALSIYSSKSTNQVGAAEIKKLISDTQVFQTNAIQLVNKRRSTGIATAALTEQIAALEQSLRNQASAGSIKFRK
ncbi:MAG: conjugal transfer protein TraH [Thiotrichales bacterium]|jgi:conjugative transfer pilus assembly protein TraH|nr:conjugal transfer protein TraH [Thiotrichales bacterium]